MENASLRYAGFWRRYVAYGIDSIIVTILCVLAIWLLGQTAHAQEAQTEDYNTLVQMGWLPAPQPGQSVNDVLLASGASGNGGLGMDSLLVGLIISGIYNIWFTAGRWQATPGKHWCKLKVIRTTGAKVSYAMSTIRWFASGVSWLPFGFGYFMVGFTREKTAMHDVICGTRVVYR